MMTTVTIEKHFCAAIPVDGLGQSITLRLAANRGTVKPKHTVEHYSVPITLNPIM